MPVPAGFSASAPSELCHDSWALASCKPEGGCPHLENLDDDMREIVEHAAVEYLWRWSGRRFGLCSVSVRPCEEDCTKGSTWRGWSGSPAGFPFVGAGFFPYIWQGSWFNAICNNCNTQRCGCARISTVVLPGPVNEILEILIDGEIVNPNVYRLDNLGLSRLDGTAWPRCQNMLHDPDGESPVSDASDTFQVTYLQGVAVPAAGQLAAGTLACELAKQACGGGGCRLPKRVQTVQREGVTITLPNDDAFFSNGSTGIWEIDMFLSSVQQENRTGYRVTSPDTRPYRRVY